MKRRGRKLVELVGKEDCINERKQTTIIATNTFESCNDERDYVESPVPRGCEKEIEFLIQENIINSELDSDVENNMNKPNQNESASETVILSAIQNLQNPELNNGDPLEPAPSESQVVSDTILIQLIEESNQRITCQLETGQSEIIPQTENLSVSMADIVLDSPTSSFTIPTPLSSAVSSPVGSPSTRRCIKKRGPGKIRTSNPTEWKDLKRKALKNSGKAFINKKGETVPEKKIKSPCSCPKKCFEKLEENDRQHIFNSFWEIGSHEKQWDFILKFVKSHRPKRIKAEGPNRSQTRVYSLPINNGSIVVCRKMFLNTLSISEKVIRSSFSKRGTATNEHILLDLRGKHHNRPKKIKEIIVDSVKNHIVSLAPVESHYCRKSSTKRYLDGQLSYKRLHDLYTEWFDPQTYSTQMASLRQYQDIVNTNFNIAFYNPKKDQCDRCHAFYNNREPTETQKKEQDLHIQRKNLARTLKAADKAKAEGDPCVVTATFDMQKILNCPHGNVSIFYYKRKLNVYDFTVYDVARKSGFCYMWTEVMGKKGANEISSGLNLFIKSKIDEGAKSFIFWSDNCSGQNRNRIVFAFYQHILEKFDIECITHRFLEVGHTQNEGDSVHSVIEGASSKKTIYTPDQWINLIRWAKTTGQTYRVKEMTLADIYNYRKLLDGKNWLKNDDGEKVVWNKIKEVQVSKDNINVLKYKYELDEDYKKITTLRKGTRGKKTVVSEVTPVNGLSLKINYDKYKDLMSMCEAKIIPEEYHTFFRTLPHEQTGNANISESTDEEDD